MQFTLERAKDLFNKGQFSAISQAAGSDVSSLRLLQPDVRVLIAHANVYAGRVQLASVLAESVRQTTASASAIAQSFIVSGLNNKREGQIERAAAEFRNALRISRESQDKTKLAWAHAH